VVSTGDGLLERVITDYIRVCNVSFEEAEIMVMLSSFAEYLDACDGDSLEWLKKINKETIQRAKEGVIIKFVSGDLLEATENFIVHQVNCKGVMGSGVARQIKNKWPIVYAAYKGYLSKVKPALGNVQLVMLSASPFRGVINAFGQDTYGYDGKQYTNYSALSECFSKIRDRALKFNCSVALPYKFGSDRGGADWREVLKIMARELNGVTITFYKYSPR
jgi:O-acetyl-ADP-ribose deacetylase (regulator of RNase III)